MKKILQLSVLLFFTAVAHAQTDFVPGYNVIFQDDFGRDPVGDFPARWNTSGEGQVVQLDGVDGKWLKIMMPTSVSPELKKSLPENCTIEFDLYMRPATGVAPHIMFGLTSLSNVAAGDVYRRHLSVTLQGYNAGGHLVCAKNITDLVHKDYALDGFVERVLHVSISLNKTRLRVYFDEEKVVDLPKILTPDFRKNFFVAASVVGPAPEEGIYISNVKIAEGSPDARSLLIKQLLEEGSVVTSDIQFSANNQITQESQPVVDQLGQALEQNPDMNIQINTMEESFVASTENTNTGGANAPVVNKTALKQKAEKIKAYIINKFNVESTRILTDAKAKLTKAVDKNKTATKAKKFLTEIIKL